MVRDYDAAVREGLEAELERQLDILAGTLFIETTFHKGRRPDLERFLSDLYEVLEEFLVRWRSLNAPHEP